MLNLKINTTSPIYHEWNTVLHLIHHIDSFTLNAINPVKTLQVQTNKVGCLAIIMDRNK